jgi:hypothetical protein
MSHRRKEPIKPQAQPKPEPEIKNKEPPFSYTEKVLLGIVIALVIVTTAYSIYLMVPYSNTTKIIKFDKQVDGVIWDECGKMYDYYTYTGGEAALNKSTVYEITIPKNGQSDMPTVRSRISSFRIADPSLYISNCTL